MDKKSTHDNLAFEEAYEEFRRKHVNASFMPKDMALAMWQAALSGANVNLDAESNIQKSVCNFEEFWDSKLEEWFGKSPSERPMGKDDFIECWQAALASLAPKEPEVKAQGFEEILRKAIGEFSAICMRENPSWVFPSTKTLEIADRYAKEIAALSGANAACGEFETFWDAEMEKDPAIYWDINKDSAKYIFLAGQKSIRGQVKLPDKTSQLLAFPQVKEARCAQSFCAGIQWALAAVKSLNEGNE